METQKERAGIAEQIEIRTLEPNIVDDFLTFFDGPAFADNPDWSGCYCQFFMQALSDEQWCARTKAENREASRREVLEGRQKGFLAYRGGEPVAWCQAGPKTLLPRIMANEKYITGEEAKTYSITCFVVSEGERRRGLATALLAKAEEDASKKGFAFIESYPASGNPDSDAHNYHGPESMYLMRGFAIFRDGPDGRVFRKALYIP
jgi:GNAT superfamily N-acetyltransferase